MTWHVTVIDTTRSVSQNSTPLIDNSTYIDTIMKVDHFWDDTNSNLDGHHLYVQMPKWETPPFNPAVDIKADMDGVFYMEEITKEDATTEVNAFYANKEPTTNLLGIRAAVNFTGEAVPVLKWQHNVATVVRDSEGIFTITYSVPMPSNFYCISIMGYRAATGLSWEIAGGGSWDTRVLPGSVQIRFKDQSNVVKNPTQASFFIIGG